MPTYTFLNRKTKKIEEHTLKISEYDAFKKANPHLERYHDVPPAVTFNGRTFTSFDSKTDDSWKEVLSKIGEKHKGSPLHEDKVRKTTKEVKTRQAIKRHAQKMITRTR